MRQSLSLLSMTSATVVPSSISVGTNNIDSNPSTYRLLTLNNNSNDERYSSIVKSRNIVDKYNKTKSASWSTNRTNRTKGGTINNSSSSIKTLLLYLIRHGEAVHNVKEKAAKQRAMEEAMKEGHESDSKEARYRMEEARKAVLNDHQLYDAPLSEFGQAEARNATYPLQQLIVDNGLELPSEVWVSPLQRTLQTADILFPDHMNIHVREEIRERCTGLPPDTYAISELLRRKNTFERFSMTRLKKFAKLKELELEVCGYSEACSDASLEKPSSEEVDKDYTSCNNNKSVQKKRKKEESRAMLRTRTKKLFHLLAESDHRSIAVVTHKGYLRELERGPFEQTNAKEFKNCEMRVYKVSINKNDDLEDVSRII